MSTRSGKRIHNSLHENLVENDEAGLLPISKKKTRSRRLKEIDETDLLSKNKRENYVTYPGDGEVLVENATVDAVKAKNSRRTRRHTLKDHNQVELVTDTDVNIVKKNGRVTRRTKKFDENSAEVSEVANGLLVEATNENVKKKSKKKKVKGGESNNDQIQEEQVTKKSQKKKKGKRDNLIIVEDVSEKPMLNKSIGSNDSFHSAAGSPLKDRHESHKPDNSMKVDTTSDRHDKQLTQGLNNTFNKDRRSTRQSIKNTTFDKLDDASQLETSNAFEKNYKDPALNNTFDKERRSKRSSVKNSTFDKIEQTPQTKSNTTLDQNNEDLVQVLNSTYDNETTSKRKSNIKNSTFDKIENVSVTSPSALNKKKPDPTKHNSTFEVETVKKSLQLNTSADKQCGVNTTFDKTSKDSKTVSLNSTFDKEIKLDTTFDKTGSQSDSVKSSLISSDDDKGNLTFDKSENSRISITSDDSRTENIVNTTPLLIESSLDESKLSNTSKQSEQDESNQKVSETEDLKTPLTPLKREGTFTKDGSGVATMSPKPKSSTEKTPTKRISLPSPGYTPFHTRSSQREKSALNVTRSIEKSATRSSLAEIVPRLTKVMFCSPMNNPAVVIQQKRKVIKSSLKGSNKSFVFDESASKPALSSRPGPRKRSLTLGADGADSLGARAKRQRLAGDLLRSVERLSRPRTLSAAAKLSEPSPSRKPSEQPPEQAGRTKLPDFAALHRRNFDRMESLDECQRRRAIRAKRLLTPTHNARTPAGAELQNPKESAKKPETLSKMRKTTSIVDALRPGYTRFGFRLDSHANPFSVPTKSETKTKTAPKPKENKPNCLNREPTLPSLSGVSRREAAKHVVMKEKSFTSLANKTNEKRKDNRTVIKGVRTNRRFELQMKHRNIN